MHDAVHPLAWLTAGLLAALAVSQLLRAAQHIERGVWLHGAQAFAAVMLLLHGAATDDVLVVLLAAPWLAIAGRALWSRTERWRAEPDASVPRPRHAGVRPSLRLVRGKRECASEHRRDSAGRRAETS